MTARTSLERREGIVESWVETSKRRIVRWWLWQGGTIAYPSLVYSAGLGVVSSAVVHEPESERTNKNERSDYYCRRCR
jgi:hypothetical protein